MKKKPLASSDTPEKNSWEFKRFLRARSFGWRGSDLARRRLGEAVKEISGVAKYHPMLAGDGAIALCERIWPAFQDVDTSSGALGVAVHNAVEEMVTLLADAPASASIRRRWLEKLLAAVQADGVDYLHGLRENWGRLCGTPEIASEWADRTLPTVQEAFSDQKHSAYSLLDSICLSCLLKSQRYDELRSLLDRQHFHFWHYDRYWADALQRQDRIGDAIDYAEALLQKSLNDRPAIMGYCETLLIEAGREDEAYIRYGISRQVESTYLNHFRSIKRRYPNHDPRGILSDLIEHDAKPEHWFAAAFRSGYTDIALDCGQRGNVDPKTLIRAAQSSLDENPVFARSISYRALELLLAGYGYETTGREITEAFEMLSGSARRLEQYSEALTSVRDLIAAQKHASDVTRVLNDLLAKSDSPLW